MCADEHEGVAVCAALDMADGPPLGWAAGANPVTAVHLVTSQGPRVGPTLPASNPITLLVRSMIAD